MIVFEVPFKLYNQVRSGLVLCFIGGYVPGGEQTLGKLTPLINADNPKMETRILIHTVSHSTVDRLQTADAVAAGYDGLSPLGSLMALFTNPQPDDGVTTFHFNLASRL